MVLDTAARIELCISRPIHLPGFHFIVPRHLNGRCRSLVLYNASSTILWPEPLASIAKQPPPIVAPSLFRIYFAPLVGTSLITSSSTTPYISLTVWKEKSTVWGAIITRRTTILWSFRGSCIQTACCCLSCESRPYFITLQGRDSIDECTNLIDNCSKYVWFSLIWWCTKEVIVAGNFIIKPASVTITC